MPTELQTSIQSAVQAIPTSDFRSGHLDLLKTLGYESTKTIPINGAKPAAFLEMLEANAPDANFDKDKALYEDWKKADLLFQFTDEELDAQVQKNLFDESGVQPGLLQSYLFFAIELNGKSAVNGSYARGKLTAIARQINRAFPMPVMVLIQHPEQGRDVLSIAVINRRANKREQHKDVLGKVTIIRDISLADPHRGHLDILESFAVPNLKHPQKLPINSFETLYTAWEEIFNVELLNKRFYKELANWYFWALPQVDFPTDLEPDDEKRRATGLIRLLTRLIFCWFIKEKGLIPEKLFHRADLADILKDFDPDSRDSSQYYQAILQNLFFATLNQRMGKDSKGEPFRHFVPDEGFLKNKKNHDLNNYYRYEALFAGSQEDALAHFADIPFLNGGLFECLDRRIEEDKKTYYLDGFSRNAKKRPSVPNYLFFADEIKGIDLSDVYHDNRRKTESVSGLIRILNRYKFTIVENTPIDQEIALDPELLGKVFENLLASYNEETKTTARKQTGSFYTPRPIVDYMVDESLKAHLLKALTTEAGMSNEDAQTGLDILFAYTEKEHAFTDREKNVLIRAIDRCKILDPACGSGAFPMGILHKLVFILSKLDPGNERWKQTQLDKLDSAPMREELERNFEDNEDDYGRKLYLIENCLYGVDIQPIAIQISKLRFFISLICDQKTNRDKAKNHGIRPLPNLETKFVAADTLIGLPEMDQSLLIDPRVDQIEKEIASLYHRHFGIQRRDQKLALQRRIKDLRKELGSILAESLMAPAKAQHVANWDPFDPQASSDFFDPHWMFGKNLSMGFDIVIGNPPYISVEKFADSPKQKDWKEAYDTYANRGDVYCFFYERGAQLLKIGGSLVYITSNKWMRASYGARLRRFLSTSVDTESVLDFGMAQNFSAATTYTCITRFYRQAPDNRVCACYATDARLAMADPASYFTENAVLQPNLSEDSWVVLSKERQNIKTSVEAKGIPLKNWELEINSGIKTSHNKAFIVNAEKYKMLVSEDPASARILHPILRGEDVKKYQNGWKQYYVIGTFKQIRDSYSLDDYPAIKRHLSKFRSELEPRPKNWNPSKDGKWPGRNTQPFDYLWYEVFFSPNLSLFRRPKIMYPNMTKFMPFYLDKKANWFCNQKAFIITGKEPTLDYLTAFFNSSIFRCCFKDDFPELLGNTYELSKKYFKEVPVLKVLAEVESFFSPLIELTQLAKSEKQDAAYNLLEALIDACVMECYFREHMAERDLLFQDAVAAQLKDYAPEADIASQTSYLETLHTRLQATDLPQKLQAIPEKSPDLLGVILKEGKV